MPREAGACLPYQGRWLEEPEGLNFATVLNVLGNGEVLSPTRFAGAPLAEGAKSITSHCQR